MVDKDAESTRLTAENAAQKERIAKQSDRLSAYRTQIDTKSEIMRANPLALLSGHEVNGILHSLHYHASNGNLDHVKHLTQELSVLFDSVWAHQSTKFGVNQQMYPIEEFDLGDALDKGPFSKIAWHKDITLMHDLRGVKVTACRLPLLLAVRTLLVNSIRAMDGMGTIRVGYFAEEKTLIFEDTGPGIQDQDRDLLFASLVPASAARGDGSISYGIGLAAARESLRQTGGDMWHIPTYTGAMFAMRLGTQEVTK